MGLCNSPDIFQEKMNELLIGLETVHVYIDNIFLHVTKGMWQELLWLQYNTYRHYANNEKGQSYSSY